jgi:hypothetical protein
LNSITVSSLLLAVANASNKKKSVNNGNPAKKVEYQLFLRKKQLLHIRENVLKG